MTSAQTIASLMYSYTDWREIARDKEGNYCFEIISPNKVLFYFGSNHSRDMHDEQYPLLEAYWRDFLKKTSGKNSVVLIEGGRRAVHETKELAIRRDAEGGYITLLAHEAGIPVEVPESDPLGERAYVLETFSRDELDCYYFSRLVNAWHTMPEPRPPFEGYMERYSEHRSEIKNWVDYGFPLEPMKDVYKHVTGNVFNLADRDMFALLINPTTEKNPLQKVVIATSTYRNIRIVQEIERLWNEGRSIFIVYGSAHPILQEPALRSILVS